MVFGRTRKQFWEMTPGELFLLIEEHNAANDPNGDGRAHTSGDRQWTPEEAPAVLSHLASLKFR